jgi:hypothetical protein
MLLSRAGERRRGALPSGGETNISGAARNRPDPLALSHPKLLYDLLFRCASETLLEIAADPKHLGLASASWPCSILGARS